MNEFPITYNNVCSVIAQRKVIVHEDKGLDVSTFEAKCNPEMSMF